MNNFRGNRGYVTVMFAILSIIIVGVISYNIYVSSNVNEIIHLQNSADISSYTFASYSARGLNFISANNVAIASSLHIATSVPILATYLSAAKVFSQTIASYSKDKLTSIAGGDSSYQKVWNRLKPIPANYLRISSGLSKVNRFIVNHWILLSYIEGIKSFDENTKDSKGILFVGEEDKEEEADSYKKEESKDMEGFFDNIMGMNRNSLNEIEGVLEKIEGLKGVLGKTHKLKMLFEGIRDKKSLLEDIKEIKRTVGNLKYSGLYQSSASESICFILSGSKKNIKYRRDDVLFWLSGMIPKALQPKMVSSLSEIENAVKKVLPGKIGFYECGIDFKVGDSSIGNGFNYKREFEYFEKDFDRLGLIVIDDMDEFKKGLKYRGKFWKKTKYGIMGRTDGWIVEEGKDESKKISVETVGEVQNRVEDKEAGLFYPEWYPVLLDKDK